MDKVGSRESSRAQCEECNGKMGTGIQNQTRL